EPDGSTAEDGSERAGSGGDGCLLPGDPGHGHLGALRSRKEEKKCSGDGMEITLLAGRKISLLVGIFTLTATWVGGGFILGIAEATYNPTLGAVWALMPVPYIVTFFLGGYQVCLFHGYWATAVLHHQCADNTYSSAVCVHSSAICVPYGI
ncbi:unnamed protein product, partial [Tetraodon nigroviridis]